MVFVKVFNDSHILPQIINKIKMSLLFSLDFLLFFILIIFLHILYNFS